MKRLILFTLILSISTAKAQNLLSGFSLNHKEKVAVLGIGFNPSSSYFLKDSELAFSRNINIANFYAAVGLKNKWNIIATYAVIDFLPQDFKLGISKGYFNKKKCYMVGGLGVFGPSSNYNTESASAIGQQASGLWFEHVIQYRSNYHIDLNIGFNLTQNPTPNSLPISLSVGKGLKKSYLKLFSAYQYSFGNKFYRGTGDEAPTTFKELAVSYLKAGGQFIYTKGKWQPYAGFAYTLAGSNTFKGPSYSIGIIRKL